MNLENEYDILDKAMNLLETSVSTVEGLRGERSYEAFDSAPFVDSITDYGCHAFVEIDSGLHSSEYWVWMDYDGAKKMQEKVFELTQSVFSSEMLRLVRNGSVSNLTLRIGQESFGGVNPARLNELVNQSGSYLVTKQVRYKSNSKAKPGAV